MRHASRHSAQIDHFIQIINCMAPNEKDELLSKLDAEGGAKHKNNESWKSLFGALQLDEPDEHFLEDLKRDRASKDK